MDEIIKIKRIDALSNMKLLVEFTNGITKIYDTKKLTETYDFFAPLTDPEIFGMACVDYNGSAVIWNEDMDVSEWELWTNGVELPLTPEDLNIANNQISDLTPLSSLSHLTSLTAFGNVVTDPSPLSTITSLRNLSLSKNTLTDAERDASNSTTTLFTPEAYGIREKFSR